MTQPRAVAIVSLSGIAIYVLAKIQLQLDVGNDPSRQKVTQMMADLQKLQDEHQQYLTRSKLGVA